MKYPPFYGGIFMLVEIFAYVGLVVKVLSYANDNGRIFLLLDRHDLITSLILLKVFLVLFDLLTIVSELRFTAETAIFLLHKYKRLKNTTCFYTLHCMILLSRYRGSGRTDGIVIQRGSSETYSLDVSNCRRYEQATSLSW